MCQSKEKVKLFLEHFIKYPMYSKIYAFILLRTHFYYESQASNLIGMTLILISDRYRRVSNTKTLIIR